VAIQSGTSAVCGILALFVASAYGAEQPRSFAQTSTGACSPPIISNTGHVSISCPGVGEEALRFLEERLTTEFKSVLDRIDRYNDSERTIRNQNDHILILQQKADYWFQKYEGLTKSNVGMDGSEVAKRAWELIRKFQLDEAQQLLKKREDLDRSNIRSAAETQFALGSIDTLRFDWNPALIHLEKAFDLEPNNALYADSFAVAAWFQGDKAKAEKGWEAAIKSHQSSASGAPDGNRSDIAAASNNLANVYADTDRSSKAEEAYKNALAIRREQARGDKRFLDKVALILNNLGLLYDEEDRARDAEAVLKEARAINQAAYSSRPDEVRRGYIGTLNRLAVFYYERDRQIDAERALNEALSVVDASDSSDQGYQLDRSEILHNLAHVYAAQGNAKKVEESFRAAAAALRLLGPDQADVYQGRLSQTLNTLGLFYSNVGRSGEAETAFREALDLRRGLASRNKDARQLVAETLLFMGVFYHETNRDVDSERAYSESANIFRNVATDQPETGHLLVTVLMARAEMIRGLASNRNPEAVEYQREAVAVARTLANMDFEQYIGLYATAAGQLVNTYDIMGRRSDATQTYRDATSFIGATPPKSSKEGATAVAGARKLLNDLGGSDRAKSSKGRSPKTR
jgi:Flp pilus assembly protein TadD